ncbi:MAG: Molybdenum ABC transporter ATP-binding protein ModC [uncultured Friedmanniella sp.]|uniref:Molybdenum ABC transporter ATP-binding protein ModC n=1 Tax=uncultured Friedmanniella sp. TaxID=335381 RepID=A0A6J4KF94_9ACTN|nr:MAG: Molybdenum ABC transporter ATP-binding protein ModC [uncultured Friedmanniella sp.]
MVSGLAARLVVVRPAFRLDVELDVAAGEVVALVGPNGAGKSTALRALAGLLALQEGRVELDGRLLADAATALHRPAHERGVGVVFQDYLLFPHLSVLDNVAFGLTARGHPRPAARAVAGRWLARVELTALAAARPRTLSGGQAQRVALARALAPEPGLLLLDEPLAALDARTRLLVRGELRRHLQAFGGAAVVVTHDPVDAAVLADRLVVVEDGKVVQTGTPADVAARPRTDYVARLVGLNLLAGEGDGAVVRLPGGGRVHAAGTVDGPARAAFRPATVALFTRRPEGSPRNVWRGRVAGLEPHGAGVRVEVAGAPDGGSSILAEVTAAAVAELDLRPGSPVWAAVKASDVTVYPDGPAPGP